MSLVLLANGTLDGAFAAYGVPIPRGWDAYHLALSVDEDILAVDPTRVRLSFPVDDGVIVVTVDEDLTVLEHEHAISAS